VVHNENRSNGGDRAKSGSISPFILQKSDFIFEQCVIIELALKGVIQNCPR
jgi:hypothetical protein